MAHMCPSGRCRSGALLIGIVGPDRIGYVSPPLPIDAAFVAQATGTSSPEKSFRFAEPCIEAGCAQWTGRQCGVAARLVDSNGADEAELPGCGIRANCRWFAEHAARACAACPFVVTDNRGSLQPIAFEA